MLAVRKSPAPRARPRPLSEDELMAALGSAEPRTRAFLMLGYLAGLRAHEIAKFHGRDISQDRIRVVGKGRVAATIPTHPLLWELARTFPREGFWFPPAQASTFAHVSSARVTYVVGRLFRSLGIEGATHRARHTYGTTLLRGGANLRVVQELMRHSSLATTALYLGVSEEERSSAVGGLRIPDASAVEVPGRFVAPAVEFPAVPVTSLEVRQCAEVLDEFERELLGASHEDARAMFERGFNAIVATRAAERAGRLSEVDHFEFVLRLLLDGLVASQDAIVECRTLTCGLRRTPTLDLPGTTCEGCGEPRARAVGPVSGPECPPWCQTHPVEASTEYVHVGEVAAVGGMTVELRQSVKLDKAGQVVVPAPELSVLDGHGEVTLPADGGTLEALQRAVSAAGRL